MTHFSAHALGVMARRGITVDEVEQAIANPAGYAKPGTGDDTVVQSGLTDEGGILRVVRSTVDGCVVSVWWELKP
jgi:hypothetical protein